MFVTVSIPSTLFATRHIENESALLLFSRRGLQQNFEEARSDLGVRECPGEQVLEPGVPSFFSQTPITQVPLQRSFWNASGKIWHKTTVRVD
jgi:hypothetical protein